MSPILSLRPLQTQSDAKLVAMARAGHERAFEALVRRYRRQLLAYASRLAGADGRGEDALQHALLQAWIALRADAEVKDARAWLYRIVHNSAVTTLRRPRHETVELNEALDTPASDAGPESRIAVGEVLKSLASLPDLQRQAMVLTAVRGDSHGEAAATLGLSDGAVRGLIYRARTTMRDAAAALMPIGLFNWAASHSARRAPGGSNASDGLGTAGGAGSAGLAAAVLKGGAVVATAGALATAGQIAIPRIFSPSRPARSAAPAGHHAARHRGGLADSGTEVSARSVHTSLTSSATVFERRAVGNHELSRSGTSGRGHSSSGSGERSGNGAGHGASRSPGLTSTGPGGSSGSGRGSGEPQGASSGGGGGWLDPRGWRRRRRSGRLPRRRCEPLGFLQRRWLLVGRLWLGGELARWRFHRCELNGHIERRHHDHSAPVSIDFHGRGAGRPVRKRRRDRVERWYLD